MTTNKRWAGALLSIGVLLAVCLWGSGCASTPTDQQLTTLQAVSAEAAYVGTAIRLEKEPESRAQFGVVWSSLDVLVRKGQFTPGALQEALKNLPVLSGSSGAIIESGSVVFIIVAGFVNVDSAPRVKAVALGILSGMERALARSQTLATPLPPAVDGQEVLATYRGLKAAGK